MAINIDKYILGFWKDSFDREGGKMGLKVFLSEGKKHLKSWQREMGDRDNKLLICLVKLFEEADNGNKGVVEWT